MVQPMDPEKTWSTDDLDFDEEGRLIIKDESLIYYFQKHMMQQDDPVLEGDCDGIMVPKCSGSGSPAMNPDCSDVPYGGSSSSGEADQRIKMFLKPRKGQQQA